jgi:probable HAF family extracellular repeat protein
MQDLGVLATGDNAYAAGINSSGEVVGYSGARAFVWTAANGMQDLGTLGGSSSTATGVNDAGEVTGYSTLSQ